MKRKTGSPILDFLIAQGVPRSEWAVQWIQANWMFGETPAEIDD
jgi:hypothetical protein